MNSFSKLLLIWPFLLPVHALAVQLQAVYIGPCEREVGIILHTDKRNIHMLTLEGKLKKLGRYQIQNLSSYSLDHLPMSGKHDLPSVIPAYRFWTDGHDGRQLLAEGIILGSTKTGFQLIDFKGRDAYVPFQSIWEIEKFEGGKKLELSSKNSKYSFAHPARGMCPGDGGDKPSSIYVSEMLTDPVVIKRHLDRQITALQVVEKQRDAQVFYPVPQVYKNRTQIGYWYPVGNRYGSAEDRTSGLAPLIRNEFSSGPFGFQHISLTGAGPIPGTIHEEPQTMIYYGFKASYISFAGFLDPSLVLASSQYQWEKEDMDDGDNRVVESSHLALGFDRGHWSLKLFVHSHLFGGYRYNDDFSRYDGDMTRAMLSWQDRNWLLALTTSLGSTLESRRDDNVLWNDGELNFLRADARWELPKNVILEFWWINREVNFDASGGEQFKNTSHTLGAGVEWPVSKRWSLAGRFSQESVETSTNLDNEDRTFYKFAAGAYMDF